MHTQKISHSKTNRRGLTVWVITGLFVAFFLSSALPMMNAHAADPVCIPPKSKEDADKAVDPECAKSGRITLTNDDAKKAGLQNKNADVAVAKTLNGVYAIVAIVAVITIVLAGIRMTIADGDASKVAAARQTVIYAVVGLAVVGSAFIITGIVQGVGTK
jgi:hypothetical protein